jgi:hypothetical protein
VREDKISFPSRNKPRIIGAPSMSIRRRPAASIKGGVAQTKQGGKTQSEDTRRQSSHTWRPRRSAAREKSDRIHHTHTPVHPPNPIHAHSQPRSNHTYTSIPQPPLQSTIYTLINQKQEGRTWSCCRWFPMVRMMVEPLSLPHTLFFLVLSSVHTHTCMLHHATMMHGADSQSGDFGADGA